MDAAIEAKESHGIISDLRSIIKYQSRLAKKAGGLFESFNGPATAFIEGNRLQNSIINEYIIGSTVKVSGRDYVIKGPGFGFGSVQAAAIDGLATSFALTSITRDKFERGGAIRMRNDGLYEYDDLQVGMAGKIADAAAQTGILVDRGIVATFHTHPNTADVAHSANLELDKGDIDALSVFNKARTAKNFVPFYLGAYDGSMSISVPTYTAEGAFKSASSKQLEKAGFFSVPRL